MLVEWKQFLNISLDLIFKIVMQNFVALRSAILENKTSKVAVFGNFSDIFNLNLSLPSLKLDLCDKNNLQIN